MRTIKRIVVHCTATPPSVPYGAIEIGADHRERGWNGCGYHWVIRRDGERELGRLESEVGAHCKHWNSDSIGIVLEGGVDERLEPISNYTARQWATLAALVTELLGRYHAIIDICGHRDLDPNKACPCSDIRLWAEETINFKLEA